MTEPTDSYAAQWLERAPGPGQRPGEAGKATDAASAAQADMWRKSPPGRPGSASPRPAAAKRAPAKRTAKRKG